MTDLSDKALLDAARAGDRDALSTLLERYEPTVLRFGLKMCGDEEDAKEILQDTLFAAARTARDFRGDASVPSWLYTIARSFCIKRRRRPKHAPARVEPLDEGAGVADLGRSPDDALHEKRVEAALASAIEALDPGQREVLVLRDVEGLTAPEVAAIVGISVDAVKSKLHRARLSVRDKLAPLVAPTPDKTPPAPSGDTCPDVVGLFSRHLEGDVSPDVCAEMERHLAGCPRCHAACDSLKRVLATCRATPAPEVPLTIREELRKAVREAFAAGAMTKPLKRSPSR